jgi:hypothetical protein
MVNTFKEDTNNCNFDTDFKRDITNKVNTTLNGNKPDNDIIKLISMKELNETIKRLNTKNSSGLDGISNKIIKNLPEQMKKTILNLFNQSLLESKIPENWKKAEITMIPKKNNDLQNPKSYRPISMNSCLSKLCEKLILNRVKNHLKINNILIKQQSGFRQHRQTKDNLLFLIKKIQ